MIKLEDDTSKCALVYGQMNEPPGARARVALTGLLNPAEPCILNPAPSGKRYNLPEASIPETLQRCSHQSDAQARNPPFSANPFTTCSLLKTRSTPSFPKPGGPLALKRGNARSTGSRASRDTTWCSVARLCSPRCGEVQGGAVAARCGEVRWLQRQQGVRWLVL